MSRMKAAMLTRAHSIGLEYTDVPVAKANELLIRVTCTGICGSDVLTYAGHHPYKKPPIILGHEYCGYVEAVGEGVPADMVGRKVCGSAYASCLECEYCTSGREHLCRDKTAPSHADWQGSFAEYVIGKTNSVYRVDDSLDDEIVALIEPLSIAHHALNFISRGARQRDIGIIGAGSIGLSCVALARQLNLGDISCTDIDAGKAEIVSRLGGRFVSPARFQKEQYQFTLVTSGHSGALDQAISVTRPGGTIIVISYFNQPETIQTSHIVRKEISIVGSGLSVDADFISVIRLLELADFNPGLMVSHRFRLDDIGSAFKLIENRNETYNKIMLFT